MEKRGCYRPELRRAFCIAWYGGAAVLVVAYAVLVTLKCHNLLPPRMTWSRILLGPALLVLLLPTAMLITLQPRRKMFFWLLVWFLALVAIFAVVSILNPVESMPDYFAVSVRRVKRQRAMAREALVQMVEAGRHVELKMALPNLRSDPIVGQGEDRIAIGKKGISWLAISGSRYSSR